MKIPRKFSGLRPALLLAALLVPLAAMSQANFRAELSQTRVRVGERAVLSIVLEGNVSPDGSLDLPDLSPYFRVEDQIGPSVSSQMSIINGKVSKKVSVQYQFYLVAAKTGRFVIPRLAYHTGTQSYHSTPIQVEILDPQNAAETGPESSKGWGPPDDPYLQIELDKKEAYVGEQVKAGWYLYYQRNLLNLKMSAQPQVAEFKALELEKVSRLSPAEKYYKNMPWNVAFLQSLALYPIRSGNVVLGSLVLRYQSQTGRHDFFGMPVGQESELASDPVTITVKPLPEPAPDDFTGAVGRFEVKSRISKTEARAGESLQLLVEIAGDGNPEYILEPKLLLPPDFEVYPPEVKVETEAREGKLFALKKFDYVVIAKKDGDLVLPAVNFRYFDPGDKQYKYASSPPIAVRIFPGAAGSGSSPGPGAASGAGAVSMDIRFIKPDRQNLPDQGLGVFARTWYWLVQLSGLLIAGLAVYYRAYRERLDTDQVFARRLRAFGQSKKRLKKAGGLARQGKIPEFSAELKRALLEYFGDRFSASPWGLVEEEMQEVMKKESVAEGLIREYLELISVLSRSQFAGKMEQSDPEKLLERGANLIESLEKEKK